LQQFVDRLDDEWLALAIHPDHATLLANARASPAAIGARVTPWRK
jgi:hypothetical protein